MLRLNEIKYVNCTVAGTLNKGNAAADSFHSFFLSLTEYIQAMILVNEATINNNLTLIKGMYISNPNLEYSLVFSWSEAGPPNYVRLTKLYKSV